MKKKNQYQYKEVYPLGEHICMFAHNTKKVQDR